MLPTQHLLQPTEQQSPLHEHHHAHRHVRMASSQYVYQQPQHLQRHQLDQENQNVHLPPPPLTTGPFPVSRQISAADWFALVPNAPPELLQMAPETIVGQNLCSNAPKRMRVGPSDIDVTSNYVNEYQRRDTPNPPGLSRHPHYSPEFDWTVQVKPTSTKSQHSPFHEPSQNAWRFDRLSTTTAPLPAPPANTASFHSLPTVLDPSPLLPISAD